jgi:hypothetical protein
MMYLLAWSLSALDVDGVLPAVAGQGQDASATNLGGACQRLQDGALVFADLSQQVIW